MNGDFNGWMDVPEGEREAMDEAWVLIEAKPVSVARSLRGESRLLSRPDREAPCSVWPRD